MTNLVIIILVMLCIIWCCKHEDKPFKNFDDYLINFYRGPKPPHRGIPKPPHKRLPKPPPLSKHHEQQRRLYDKHLEYQDKNDSGYFSLSSGKFWHNHKLISSFIILIVGSFTISFLSITIATIFVLL